MALLKALRRHWLRALCVAVVCASVAALATWFIMPAPKYSSRALLYMASFQPNVLFRTSEDHADNTTYQRTQTALIKGRFVLNAALRQPKVSDLSLVREQPDAAGWLESDLKVETIGPELVRISLDGDRPDELTVIVNAVTQAYKDEIVDKESHQRLQRLESLTQLYNQFDDKIQTKRRDLKELAKQVGTTNAKNLGLKQQIALETLAAMEKELVQVQIDIARLRVEIAAAGGHRVGHETEWAALCSWPRPCLPVNLALATVWQNIQDSSPHESPAELALLNRAVEEELEKDPIILQHRGRAQQLQDTIERIRAVTRPAYVASVTQSQQKALQVEKDAVEQRTRQLRPDLVKQLRTRVRTDARVKLTQMEDQLALLRERQEDLRGTVERLHNESRSLNESSLNLETLTNEIALEEGTMNQIAKEREALEVEKQAPARTKVLEEAVLYPPTIRKRIMTTAGTGAALLLLVLVGFAWWEYRYHKVNTVDEVVQGLGMKVVGALPTLAPARRRLPWGNGRSDASWQRVWTESVDAVRTILLHTSRAEGLQVIMVTSAVSGEGKTSVATHLAASLARAGCKTLLLDCDMRSPSAHRLLDRPRAPGFAEWLREECDIAGATRDTAVDGLSFIPGGRCDADTTLALAQAGLPEMFDTLRQAYDFVVVDSCPVLPVADSLLIAQHTDAVLFSILRDVSQLPKVYAAYQRLAMLDIRMLGAVVNGAEEPGNYSSYDYVTPAAD